MKKVTRKLILKSLIGIVAASSLASGIFVSPFLENNKHQTSLSHNSRLLKDNQKDLYSPKSRTVQDSSNPSSDGITRGWQSNSNDTSTTTNKIIAPDDIKNNSIPPQYRLSLGKSRQGAVESNNQSIIQNEVYSSNGNSYARITSSDGTKKDQITKYWFGPESNLSGETIDSKHVWGSAAWVVKKSDLSKLIGVDDNGTTIKSIIYSAGGQSASESLFVLLHSNGNTTSTPATFNKSYLNNVNGGKQGSYLFQINWKNQTKSNDFGNSGDDNSNAGNYRFVKKLGTEEYNFGTLLTPSEHNMQFLKLIDITASKETARNKESNNATETQIKSIFVSIKDFETDTTGTNLTEKTYKINNDIFKLPSSVSSSATYEPFWVHSVAKAGKDTIVGYKKKASSSRNGNSNNIPSIDYDFIFVKLSNEFTDSTNNEINYTKETLKDRVYKFKLPTELSFQNNKALVTKWFQLGNSNIADSIDYRFVVSNEGSNNIAYFDINIKDIWSQQDQSSKIKKSSKPNNNTNAIVDIASRYEGGNKKGYYLLDSEQRVYKTDENLENIKLVIDTQNSIYNIGKVYSIETSNFYSGKVDDDRWFAHLEQGKFAQFKDYTLIGQWDIITSQDTYELPLGINIKSQSEIDPSVIYKRVFDDGYDIPTAGGDSSGGTTFTTTDNTQQTINFSDDFDNLLDNPEAYKYFLDVHFQDPRLPDTLPEIKIKPRYISKDSNSRKYKIELSFEQTLKKIKADGQIDTSSPKTIVLAKQIYEFNNEIGSLTFPNDESSPYDVPTFIRNKLPSEITKAEVENYLMKKQNITNEKIIYIPNDSEGSMRIDVVVPYIWEGTNESSSLVTQKKYSVALTYDSKGNSLFAKNTLGITAEVTKIDESYLNNQQNNSLKDKLKVRYGAILPSAVSKKEIIESFVIFGSAFYQESNMTENELGESNITPKEQWITNVIPYDKEGYATIDITIPKVANKKNLRITFNTPKIFAVNQTSNSSVYFIFKDNGTITVDQTKDLLTIKASTIAEKLSTSGSNSNSASIKLLENFADFSDYYYTSIANGTTKINAIGNDQLGTLKITIQVSNEGEKLPGFSSNKLETIFSGFEASKASVTAENIELNETLTGDISNVSPLNVTANDLLNSYNLIKKTSKNNNRQITEKDISLTASSISGTLKVVLTLENYYDGTTIYPFKSFTKTYSGFKKSKESIDMIVWKSSFELFETNNSYKNKSPSEMKQSLSTFGELEKLKELTKISTDLMGKLDESSVSMIIDTDDDNGSLNVNAILNIDGEKIVLKNEFTGFIAKNQPSIILLPDSDKNTDLLELKRTKLPSEITIQDIESLYEFKNSKSYGNDIVITSDDATGTLVVEAKVYDIESKVKIDSRTQKYVGFKTFIPPGKGTNWGIVATATIVPIIIMIIPIIMISVLDERKRIKKVAKRLNNRLTEQYKKSNKD